MKNLRLTLVAMVFAVLSVVGANKAQAQATSEEILQAAAGLVTVQVGAININAVDVIDVSNVLNNNTVTVVALNDILNGITIDNVLNDLLRSADIISRNQIVVGVLSNGTTFLVMDQKANPKKK
jgi:hypothetical protein